MRKLFKKVNGQILLRLAFIFFNVIIISIYWIHIDIPSKTVPKLLSGLVCFCLLALVLLTSKRKFAATIHNLQLTLFTVLIFFCIIEIAASFFPKILPISIRLFYQNKQPNQLKIEYLDKNPFVVIKPNVTVRSMGERGTEDQFTYEWKTDKWGFKNLPDYVDMKKYKAVAVGDSFTEGMGVATDKIWTSLLSKNSYPTYNLGVQSYAPSQFEGVFRLYGLRCKADYVIIGYTGGIYIRETMLWGAELLSDKDSVMKYIKQKPAASLLEEIRYRSSSATSAFILAINFYYNKRKQSVQSDSVSMGPVEFVKGFDRYGEEIMTVGSNRDHQRIDEIEKYKKEWEKTLSSFLRIKEMASTIGAETIIVYFPHRGEMYYEKALQKKLPDIYFEKYESEMMRKFAAKNGIIFLDVQKAMLDYMDKVTNVKEFPYLEIDGHMSEKGHMLVASELIKYLKRPEEQ